MFDTKKSDLSVFALTKKETVNTLEDIIFILNKIYSKKNNSYVINYIHRYIIPKEYIILKNEECENCFIIKMEKLGFHIVINTKDPYNIFLFDNKHIDLQIGDILKEFRDAISIVTSFVFCYHYNTNREMKYNDMIKFIRRFKYIPIRHEYFDSNEFVFSTDDNFKVRDESGYLFEDWDEGLYSGLRRRCSEGFRTGWYIVPLTEENVAFMSKY